MQSNNITKNLTIVGNTPKKLIDYINTYKNFVDFLQ